MSHSVMPTAMILAAGKGTRMRPLTNHTPKPMLEVQGKPLLQHHLEKLWLAGVSKVVVNTSYLADVIESYIASEGFQRLLQTFADTHQLSPAEPLSVVLSYEGEQPLETAGGIVKALPELTSCSQMPFIVVNGDAWCDMDYHYLVKRAHSLATGNALAELVLVANPAHNRCGDFVLSDPLTVGQASLLKNKSEALLPAESAYTFSGLSVLTPALFEDCDQNAGALGPLLRAHTAQGRLQGCYYDGYWLDVGTPERLSELERHLVSCRA